MISDVRHAIERIAQLEAENKRIAGLALLFVEHFHKHSGDISTHRVLYDYAVDCEILCKAVLAQTAADGCLTSSTGDGGL